MIGIIIGIAAVITIMSLGNGFKKSTNEQFDEAGAGKDQASISFMTENMDAPKTIRLNKKISVWWNKLTVLKVLK